MLFQVGHGDNLSRHSNTGHVNDLLGCCCKQVLERYLAARQGLLTGKLAAAHAAKPQVTFLQTLLVEVLHGLQVPLSPHNCMETKANQWICGFRVDWKANLICATYGCTISAALTGAYLAANDADPLHIVEMVLKCSGSMSMNDEASSCLCTLLNQLSPARGIFVIASSPVVV